MTPPNRSSVERTCPPGSRPIAPERTLLTTTVIRSGSGVLEDFGVTAQESGEPDRVGGPDRDDPVGAPQHLEGRGVATRGGDIAQQFFVLFEARGDVDDRHLSPAAHGIQNPGDALGGQLGPARRAADAGQHAEPAAMRSRRPCRVRRG